MKTPPTPVSPASFNIYFRLDRIVDEYSSVTTTPPMITILRSSSADDRVLQQVMSHDYHLLQTRSPDLEDHEINVFEAAFLTLMKNAATHPGALAIYVEEILGMKIIPNNQKLHELRNAIHVRTLLLNLAISDRGQPSTSYNYSLPRNLVPSTQEADIGLQIFHSIQHPGAQCIVRNGRLLHQEQRSHGFDGNLDAPLTGAMDDPKLTELLSVYREAKIHFKETKPNTEAYFTMARIVCGKAKDCIQYMVKVKPGDARLEELHETFGRTSGGGGSEAQGMKRPRDQGETEDNAQVGATQLGLGEETGQKQGGWSGPLGYGARHHLDDAPFCLWNDVEEEFHCGSWSEADWFVKRYQATSICFQFPDILIETPKPPELLPLTLAGVAVTFQPLPSSPSTPRNPWEDLHPPHDPRPFRSTTRYEGMREPRDLLGFDFRRWTKPSDEELRSLADTLFRFYNLRSVHLLGPFIFVDICHHDGRKYAERSMPRTLGGFSLNYHHGPGSSFKGLSGGQKASHSGTTNASLDLSKRLSLFESLRPGFTMLPYQRDEKIREHLDLAMAKSGLSARFSTKANFCDLSSRPIVHSSQIPDGAWFSIEGTPIHLQAHGLTLDFSTYSLTKTRPGFVKKLIYWIVGASDAFGTEIPYGAAIIQERSEAGCVAGFVEAWNNDYVFAPCLDDIIDSSWDVV
ncbi:MAG: hypothetical protein Q9213_005383 [Squamulea squamosa]